MRSFFLVRIFRYLGEYSVFEHFSRSGFVGESILSVDRQREDVLPEKKDNKKQDWLP